MDYRDILVQIDETPAARARAKAAAAVAACTGARLNGVFLKSDFLRTYQGSLTFTDAPALNLDVILQAHAKGVAGAAARAKAVFDQALAEAGVAGDWAEIPGDDSDALAARGRRHDLTIFPPAARTSLGDHRTTAAGLAMTIGGPVLIVPEAGLSPTVGETVLLAWNGSRESARALRDAWPMIARAKEFIVLIVSPKEEGGSDGLLKKHLEAHGREAEVIVDRCADTEAGTVLRRYVRTRDVGMVVMGVYGRSRFEESILGGVSREMTSDPPCGLFISH
jgi:nucleotide-binding universal stress UspA family protein